MNKEFLRSQRVKKKKNDDPLFSSRRAKNAVGDPATNVIPTRSQILFFFQKNAFTRVFCFFV